MAPGLPMGSSAATSSWTSRRTQFDEIDHAVIVSRESAWHRKWSIVTMSPGDLKEHNIKEVPALYTLYHEVNRLLAHRLAHLAVKPRGRIS